MPSTLHDKQFLMNVLLPIKGVGIVMRHFMNGTYIKDN
jgi:hypothetical protein